MFSCRRSVIEYYFFLLSCVTPHTFSNRPLSLSLDSLELIYLPVWLQFIDADIRYLNVCHIHSHSSQWRLSTDFLVRWLTTHKIWSLNTVHIGHWEADIKQTLKKCKPKIFCCSNLCFDRFFHLTFTFGYTAVPNTLCFFLSFFRFLLRSRSVQNCVVLLWFIIALELYNNVENDECCCGCCCYKLLWTENTE